MSKKLANNWRKEFGLDTREPPSFFASPAQLSEVGGTSVPAHTIRRAFEELKLDGVLCQDNIPVIYFRRIEKIEPKLAEDLHKTFWNQGIAPLLVLIDDTEVHVYSGLIEPRLPGNEPLETTPLIEKLKRVEEQLPFFLVSVESKQYFYEKRSWFNPQHRVDRNLLRNLKAARAALEGVKAARLAPQTLDALLCRFVFVCYLFDRGIIDRKYLEQADILHAGSLRDILRRERLADAKVDLYKLFVQLAEDFNGDLFQSDLSSEAWQLRLEHIEILRDLFEGHEINGQHSFWPSYQFNVIPVEIISAIYEYFLKAANEKEKKESGAYYTPPLLAELVLDIALKDAAPLLEKRFLDPACGSGIFLVGLFNRLAEEWRRANPETSHDKRLKGLTRILQTNLYGIDQNPTACMIAAFSLYLALLEQLPVPSIRSVLKKVKVLPRLATQEGDSNIRCADFFSENASLPKQVHFVIGNPPWAKEKESSPAVVWCKERNLPIPENQIAAAFLWKAPELLLPQGRVCFLAPHGLLFNHTKPAIKFQKQWFRAHSTELILNLADYQYFLFEDARAPALVFRYTKEKPESAAQKIDYWSPKSDWSVMYTGVISVQPQDRARLTLREVLNNLESEDAPSIWKERYWATFRDRRFLERLRSYPRLRDIARLRQEKSQKRWLVAEGFEPFGENDKPKTPESVTLPQTARIEAGTHDLDLILSPRDCKIQETLKLELRRGISDTDIFTKPLVLIKRGASTQTQVAFADFNVAYRNGIRGIHGPEEDRDLLILLTFYLRSRIAEYFLFHLSGSWGQGRARTDLHDLMRLPFPLPEDTDNPTRAKEIVAELGKLMKITEEEALHVVLGRDYLVEQAQKQAEPLIEEYLGLDDTERILITDTERVVLPSFRPSTSTENIPTLQPVDREAALVYEARLCGSLNRLSKEHQVHAKTTIDQKLGVGLVVLEKTPVGKEPTRLDLAINTNLLVALTRLQHVAEQRQGALSLLRGLKIFDKNLLYLPKPIGLRFWTETAALNDADEITGFLMMQAERQRS